MGLIERWIRSGITTPTLGVITTRTARGACAAKVPFRHRARHLVRDAGVFRAGLPAARQAPRADARACGRAIRRAGAVRRQRGGRVPWAELLRRVFAAADVLACPCGGRRRVLAVVVDSAIARTLLAALGLPCAAATFAPARAPSIRPPRIPSAGVLGNSQQHHEIDRAEIATELLGHLLLGRGDEAATNRAAARPTCDEIVGAGMARASACNSRVHIPMSLCSSACSCSGSSPANARELGSPPMSPMS